MMITTGSERQWTASRAPLWDELAALVDERVRRPRTMDAERIDLLCVRYQQAAADVAVLRSREPSSPLLPRLNDLVVRAHAAIHPSRGGSVRALGSFLWIGYPRLVWELRRPIAVCASLGIAITLAAFAWALADPVSAAGFLPPNIRDAAYFKHEPIAAGLMGPEAAGIFTNNILVSFYAFGGGLTLGVLTLYIVYANSMLLGVLSGVVNHDGFNSEYWSLILPHGLLELSAFAIAGGAGLAIADAIVRARPEPRSAVLRRQGAKAGLVAAGTIPLLVIAGVIEGFITPSGLSIPAKLAVGPVTALLLAAYLIRGRHPDRSGNAAGEPIPEGHAARAANAFDE
jgi:uncharacterized membrane protein SpoIIM required for sporulation